MKCVRNSFFNLSIKSKIILFVYITVIVVFIVLSLILLFLAENNAREKLLSSSEDVVTYGNLLIEKEQQYLYGIAAYYALAPELQELLHVSNAGEQGVGLTEDIISVSQSGRYVLGLSIYNARGESIVNMSIDESHGPVDQSPADVDRPFHRLITGQRTYEWEYIPKGDTVYMLQDNSPKLCLWYVVRDNSTMRPIGVIAIPIDTRKLLTASSVPDGSYETLLVVDHNARAVFGYGDHYRALNGECLTHLLDETNNYQKTGSFATELGGKSYYAVFRKVEGNVLTTYVLIPRRQFFWDLDVFFVYSVVGIALCMVILFPLLVLISNTITKPLNKLSEAMQIYRNERQPVSLNFKYWDEIGRLGAIFTEIVTENNELIEKTYKMKIREQAAELATLQAQINPHFIYNMLNAIQWSAISKGDHEIAEIANSMARVFRLSLNRGSNFITLSQEFELLHYYLSLQQKRFGDRLTYALEFDQTLSSLEIPKLLIQPLVENAVLHGIPDSNATVHVIVRVAMPSDGTVRITVVDNGKGIEPEQLALLPDKIPAKPVNEQGSRFAMKNIAERLRLYYQEDYRFHIASEPGNGVQITIELPAKRAEDESRQNREDGRVCFD